METWMYFGIGAVASFILALICISLRIKNVRLNTSAIENDKASKRRWTLFNTSKKFFFVIGIILVALTLLQSSQ